VAVPVTKYKKVTQHRDATGYRTENKTRNVTKYRQATKHREVTRYRTATRMVTKSVEYTLPIQDFYKPALDEILAEARRNFSAPAIAPVDEVYPSESVSQVGHSNLPLRGDAENQSLDADDGEIDDGESSWISGGHGPHCFASNALFEVASGSPCTHLLSAAELVCGSRVHAADNLDSVLEVTRVSREKARTLLQLHAGLNTAPLTVSPHHRMVVPAFGGGEHDVCEARNLRPGDHVVCSGGEVRALTEVRTMEGDFEVIAITFDPDLPVAVFHAPPRGYRVWVKRHARGDYAGAA